MIRANKIARDLIFPGALVLAVLLLIATLILGGTSCTATGGSPITSLSEERGEFRFASDGNTTLVVGHGDGYAMLRVAAAGAQAFVPLYPPLTFAGEGVWVWVREPSFSARFAPGESLPAELEPYIRGLLAPPEIAAWGITFAQE